MRTLPPPPQGDWPDDLNPRRTVRHRLQNGYFRARGLLARRHSATVIATGPHPVVKECLAWPIGHLLNLKFELPANARGARFAYWFEMTLSPPVRRTADDYFGELPALNARCGDISKRRVMRIAEEVFGYTYEVDPLTHAGPMVCKGDGNAAHDGRLIQGPIEADAVEPSCVYQRLIDTRSGVDLVEDLKICVIGREAPYVFLKRRPESLVFASRHHDVELVDDALSAAETAQILAFAERFGLDIGEMDLARDRADGRIYVLDVNSTPFTPPLQMPSLQAISCMHAAADAFRRQFLAAGYLEEEA